MTCPYCGFENIIPVIPKKDLVKSVNADANAEGSAGGGVGVEFWKNPYPRSHTYCESCDKSYNLTSVTSEYILQNSGAKNEESGERIAQRINYYYSDQGMNLSTLISDHCTGIVRPYRTKIPYISSVLLRKKLHVCFNVNEQRTYLALTKYTKKVKGNNIDYYRIDSLEISI
jgi:hypothetical protein